MAEQKNKTWKKPSQKSAQSAAPKDDLLSQLKADAETQKDFAGINAQTMAIPFLRILQSMSPQVKKNNDAYIEGAEEGLFFNTVSKTVYGKEISLIVLRFERIYIEWLPEREGFVAYHDPANAERIATDKTFGKWKHGDNLLQENYVYMVLVVGHEDEGPMVLSLASTMIKTARIWNRLLTTHIEEGVRIASSALVWSVTTEYVKDDKYDWYIPSVSFEGLITADQLTFVKKERLALPSRQIDYAQLEGGKGESEETSESDPSNF